MTRPCDIPHGAPRRHGAQETDRRHKQTQTAPFARPRIPRPASRDHGAAPAFTNRTACRPPRAETTRSERRRLRHERPASPQFLKQASVARARYTQTVLRCLPTQPGHGGAAPHRTSPSATPIPRAAPPFRRSLPLGPASRPSALGATATQCRSRPASTPPGALRSAIEASQRFSRPRRPHGAPAHAPHVARHMTSAL